MFADSGRKTEKTKIGRAAAAEFVFANLIEKATHVTIFWNLARNPGKNSSKIRRKNAKFEFFAIELMKFINSIAKMFW